MRAVRLVFWWYLTSKAMGEPYKVYDIRGDETTEQTPTLFGLLGFACAVVCVVWTGASAFSDATTAYPVFACGAFVLIRAWLRIAMHLDEPDSMSWWQERLS